MVPKPFLYWYARVWFPFKCYGYGKTAVSIPPKKIMLKMPRVTSTFCGGLGFRWLSSTTIWFWFRFWFSSFSDPPIRTPKGGGGVPKSQLLTFLAVFEVNNIFSPLCFALSQTINNYWLALAMFSEPTYKQLIATILSLADFYAKIFA